MFQRHRDEEAARTAHYETEQARALAQDRELAERQAAMSEQHSQLLRQNTALTEQVARLTQELHETVCRQGGTAG